MSYVIIGNSVAAVGAIEAIRKVDKEIRITVISDELYSVYSRPLISEYLAGQVKEELMAYREASFYDKNGVTTMLGRTVVSIDSAKKTVKLDNGEEVAYSKLLIATGGTPFVPPMKGLELSGVMTFIKMDDAKKIDKLVPSLKHVVVIGAGLIGLKAAESLRHRGVEVTVVELADRVMATVLDSEGGNIVQNALEEAGVKRLTGDTVAEILGSKKGVVNGVKLKSGNKLACDAVIVAIGVIPNAKFAKESGVEVNRGIVVDNRMKTNLDDIYAAGDVAEGPDYLSGGVRVLPIWPNAYMQGKIAGFNMAGVDREFEGGVAMNSIELFGVPVITAGLSNTVSDDLEVLTKIEIDSYRKIVLRGSTVVGAVFVGKVDRAGIVTGLIRDQIDISSMRDRLLADDFGYIDFPIELRKERLGVS
ncbi:MAG: NAD(P)/FAD-dependent oxidoreductase [Rubrobacteridae bacterium]|nr:NAD(P)/FAD-dependent oxidoreductase [Rubrobacteridae bacterium]